ncbi:uncharacterized protein LOC119745821 [Patiria miniata]|uniref:Thioredoxin domain-containing protein n=1 Tax=Patiria miniata TaxID=46514 RepID=A0A914BRX8_PATMI|nr:uncharacterized protein LOC119745821 [Patiria miniata]
MAHMRNLFFGVYVLVAITSVQSKLTMHQQHLKMHQEILKKKEQAAEAASTKTEGEASVTSRPETDSEPSTTEPRTAGQKPVSENLPKKPLKVNQPPEGKSPDRESSQPDKASTGHVKEAPKSGGASKKPQTGHPDPKEVPKKQGDASRDTNQKRSTEPSHPPTKSQDSVTEGGKLENKVSRNEPQPVVDTFPAKDPVSKGEAPGAQEEPVVVSDDDVIFIDKEVGQEEENGKEDVQRYPDPDLDNEDGGIGDLEGRGAGGAAKEEDDEEEDYHPDDYFDNRQQEEAGGSAKLREDEELVRSLAYKDFEDVLYDEKYNMLHFVSEGCDECERFRPHFREAARKFWQMEDDSKEVVSVNFYEVTDPKLLVRFNLRWLPTVFFFRDGVPILYEGDLNAESLVSWAFANLEVRGWSLTDANFDKETEGTKDPTSTLQWLVHFCDVDAVGCDGFMATWENAASRLKGEIEFGYVDVGTEAGLFKRFNVDPKKLPIVVLLKQGQAYWCTLPLIELTPESIVHFAKEGHLKIEKEEVPSKLSKLATAFVIASSNIKAIGITIVVTSLLLYIIYICVFRRRELSDVGNKKAV